tara:strand:+ start:1244 stop:1492 length:249 start_codon:yes stop_codon:yes gene_type:complete
MAKQDSTLSFNNYSTDVDESQMVIDLLLNPQVAQEPEYATLLELIRRRTEGVEVFAITILMRDQIKINKPLESREELLGGEE